MSSNDPTDPVKPSDAQYTLATGANNEQQQPGGGGTGNKVGHSCCGGCCDMRRAVIVVNIINVVLVSMGMFSVLAARSLSSQVDATDDDELAQALEEFNSLPLAALIVIQSVKIVLSIVGIVGALRFNEIMVGLAMAGYVFDAVFALIGLNIAGLIYAGFFAYPHGFFIKEKRAGIMTLENYPNEKQSCCCV